MLQETHPTRLNDTESHSIAIPSGLRDVDAWFTVRTCCRGEVFTGRMTAKALGLTIPQSILLRADAVISEWRGGR